MIEVKETDVFLDVITRIQPVNDTEKFFLEKYLICKTLQAGEYLVKEGQYCHYIAFILDGYIRKCNISQEGEEVTTDFHSAYSFVSSYYSFYTQQPALDSLQAITNCRFLLLPYDALQELYKHSFNMNVLGRKILEVSCVTREHWLKKMITLSAANRYEWFVTEFKDIHKVAQLQHIASFLGINPETLSRIRRKFIS